MSGEATFRLDDRLDSMRYALYDPDRALLRGFHKAFEDRWGGLWKLEHVRQPSGHEVFIGHTPTGEAEDLKTEVVRITSLDRLRYEEPFEWFREQMWEAAEKLVPQSVIDAVEQGEAMEHLLRDLDSPSSTEWLDDIRPEERHLYCTECRRRVGDYKSEGPLGHGFAPEWWATMREQGIDPATGHRRTCRWARRGT